MTPVYPNRLDFTEPSEYLLQTGINRLASSGGDSEGAHVDTAKRFLANASL